jgi:hypothetical protein
MSYNLRECKLQNSQFVQYRLEYNTVIDGNLNTLVTNINVGRYPLAFGYNNLQNRIYVANFWGSSISVIRDVMPGMEERSTLNATRNTFEVYPNPAKAFFTLRLPLSADRTQIKIFDVSGKLVKEIGDCLRQPRNDRTGELRVSLKGISPGIYFLQLTNDPETKKLVITK